MARASRKENPKNGMVLDFGDLKQLVNRTILEELDHGLLLREDCDPELAETLRTRQREGWPARRDNPASRQQRQREAQQTPPRPDTAPQ